MERYDWFRQYMPYMVHYCVTTRQVYYVNRYYKPLGRPSSDWVQYPEVSTFQTIHVWHPTEIPLTDEQLKMYFLRLTTFKGYEVIFSPNDQLKIADPIEYYDTKITNIQRK